MTFDILETMNNKSSENMTRLTHFITAVNDWSGPALTQYGQERVELGGPVVSRWLAKIANYLTNELATDLFGTGEPTPTRIYTTLQPWQDVLWHIAARATGWEVLDTRRPLPGDLFVTNNLGAEASDALESGAHVLAQPAQYLSFAWDGPLDGAMDGLAEISTQPDALIVDTPPLLTAARDEALAGSRPSAPAQGRRVALVWDPRTGAGQVLDQWMQGRSVVIIDPHAVSPNELEQILTTEDADGGLLTYRR
ncbi:Uncharacterised protein [Schaalia odontolytica]|uniref:Uncharacterized protein n=1 Tax=Schaalia odontolytica TaxID=1660 RepID=A0A2X0VKZ5_9ACTO|nr:Uncharacterised protein [Schaalia odontolytica]